MIKEIARSCEMAEHSGMGCGPYSFTSIEAEIVIDEDGERKYLHSSWVSEANTYISFEINPRSIFDLLISDGDTDKLEEIRHAAIKLYGKTRKVQYALYKDLQDELCKMIKSKMVEESLYDTEDFDEIWNEMEITY